MVMKFKSDDFHEQMQELKEVLGDLVGTVDKRNTSLTYPANVPTLKKIMRKLNREYGTPSVSDPLLDHIEWKVGKKRIHIDKACSMTNPHTWHRIHILRG